MERSKKIVILAHCILNQNSVVIPYAREMKVFKPFVEKCLDENIGILQLPCPEKALYGLKRWGHVKDQFEHPGFINPAKESLNNFLEEIKEYIANDYEILGVYGIKGSPSCGVSLTCRGDWCGEASNYRDLEDIKARVSMVEEMGIYMELFKKLLEESKIFIEFIDIEDKLC